MIKPRFRSQPSNTESLDTSSYFMQDAPKASNSAIPEFENADSTTYETTITQKRDNETRWSIIEPLTDSRYIHVERFVKPEDLGALVGAMHLTESKDTERDVVISETYKNLVTTAREYKELKVAYDNLTQHADNLKDPKKRTAERTAISLAVNQTTMGVINGYLMSKGLAPLAAFPLQMAAWYPTLFQSLEHGKGRFVFDLVPQTIETGIAKYRTHRAEKKRDALRNELLVKGEQLDENLRLFQATLEDETLIEQPEYTTTYTNQTPQFALDRNELRYRVTARSFAKSVENLKGLPRLSLQV